MAKGVDDGLTITLLKYRYRLLELTVVKVLYLEYLFH